MVKINTNKYTLINAISLIVMTYGYLTEWGGIIHIIGCCFVFWSSYMVIIGEIINRKNKMENNSKC